MAFLEGLRYELGEMEHLRVRIVFPQSPGKLDEAGSRAGQQRAGLDGRRVADLAAQDLVRELAMDEGEGPGPAAADVAPFI